MSLVNAMVSKGMIINIILRKLDPIKLCKRLWTFHKIRHFVRVDIHHNYCHLVSILLSSRCYLGYILPLQERPKKKFFIVKRSFCRLWEVFGGVQFFSDLFPFAWSFCHGDFHLFIALKTIDYVVL